MSIKKVIFGASTAGFEYLKSNAHEKIHYFADNDPTKWGKSYFGLPVLPPSDLDPIQHFVYICSTYHEDISAQLQNLNFTGAHFQRAHLTPQLVVKDYNSIISLLQSCTARKLDYCLIRNLENLIGLTPSGDVDILIHDQDIENFIDIAAPYLSATGVKIDLYGAFGTRGYRYNNMPYLPVNLALHTLAHKSTTQDIQHTDPYHELVCLLYHCVVYKSTDSGIPLTLPDFRDGTEPLIFRDSTNDYLSKIFNITKTLKLDASLTTLDSFIKFLRASGFFPGFDTYRKIVTDDIIRQRLLSEDDQYQKAQYQATKHRLETSNNRFLMLFIRERGRQEKYQAAMSKLLDDYSTQLQFVYRQTLVGNQKSIAEKFVRGGNWSDDFHNNINGGPCEILIIRNVKPNANKEFQNSYFPFKIIDDTYFIKEKLRSLLLQEFPDEENLNILHSTDDDIEFTFYSKILNLPLEKILKSDRNNTGIEYVTHT